MKVIDISDINILEVIGTLPFTFLVGLIQSKINSNILFATDLFTGLYVIDISILY